MVRRLYIARRNKIIIIFYINMVTKLLKNNNGK
nr:MAG TPA: hypothetical protein [Caudoviricetes sp.]